MGSKGSAGRETVTYIEKRFISDKQKVLIGYDAIGSILNEY